MMRTEPTWRIPVGVLALMAVLALYGAAVAHFVAPLIADWSALAQFPAYIVLGVVWLWLIPVRRFLKWMETGSWS